MEDFGFLSASAQVFLVAAQLYFWSDVRVCIMHIDSYKFGRIVIDGIPYERDIVIVGDEVEANWQRAQGHSLCVEDLESVVAARPSVVVIGRGAYGVMRVPTETIKALSELGIQIETLNTSKAVKRFNELAESGANVAAGLHLTC